MKKIGLMVVDNSVIKQLKELIIKNIDSEYRIIEIHDKEMLFTKKMDFCIIEDSFDNQGINYAKTLIENNNDMLVLIISKDGSTIFDAVGINISSYLRYQDIKAKFVPAIQYIIDYLDKRKLVLFKTDQGIVNTQTNDIVYFEYLNRMTYLNTLDKTYRIFIQNFEYLQKMLPKTFFKISRSAIINIFRLITLNSENVIMKNYENKDIAISRRRYQDLLVVLKKHAISFTERKLKK